MLEMSDIKGAFDVEPEKIPNTVPELWKAFTQSLETLYVKIEGNLTQRLDRIEDKVDHELGIINDRLEKLELIDYDPDRTVVFTGLPRKLGTTDTEHIENILKATDVQVTIRNVKRLEGRDGKPGLVKCELNDTKQKISVLRAKQKIKEIEPSTWIRSSKSHAERLNEMNTRTLLRIMVNNLDPTHFRVAANGKLIEAEDEFDLRDNAQDIAQDNKEVTDLIQRNTVDNRDNPNAPRGFGRGRGQAGGRGRGISRPPRGRRGMTTSTPVRGVRRIAQTYRRDHNYDWNTRKYTHNPGDGIEARGYDPHTGDLGTMEEIERKKRERAFSDKTPPRTGPSQPGPSQSHSPTESPERPKVHMDTAIMGTQSDVGVPM